MRGLLRAIVIISLVLVAKDPSSASAAGPWYVAPIGNNAQDCLSPASPCATINAAIAKASPSDTIYVAVGTYVGGGDEVVLLSKDITLSGGWDAGFSAQSGTSVVDGQLVRRGILVLGGVTATVGRFTVQNGKLETGGFIFIGGGIGNGGNLILSDTTVTHSINGGISNQGTLVLNNSTVSDNTNNLTAGGIDSINATAVTLNNSIVSRNSGTEGGGIRQIGGGTLTLNNSTISGNFAGFGGGIANFNTLIVNNSTITGNTATIVGGGIQNRPGALVTLKNSIIANNTADDCSGIFTSDGHNLIENTAGCVIIGDTTGNITGADPVLGPLQDNGGPTQSHALLPGSHAIDAGSPDCPPPFEDQRGLPRPVDGDGNGEAVCDIGAYEAEEPTVMTYAVNTTDDEDDETCDASHCSLREAINAANAHAGADTIAFGIPGDAPFSIQPGSALPDVADPVAIDGTTQPGFVGSPIIELDGSTAGEGVNGLVITASHSTVRGLVINRFSGHGILLTGGGGNTIEGNFIGTDATGMLALGNSQSGVVIGGGSTGNLIGGVDPGSGNVISGNAGDGIDFADSGTSGNFVQGNLIGTDATGTAALGNLLRGVFISRNANDNLIGGLQLGARNVVSGNGLVGVNIATAHRNIVQGNYIGTDVTGTAALGNSNTGIVVNGGAQGNLIGGAQEGATNLISGNLGRGIDISEIGTIDNLVLGNLIGTDVTGTQDLGNSGGGVTFEAGATGNILGGEEPGQGNVISGNDADGVAILSPGTSGNRVQGNFIGTDVTGTVALANSVRGVLIHGGAADNLIGGTGPNAGNLISANGAAGVRLSDDGTTGNKVQGNLIGTDITGTIPLGNAFVGVRIADGATSNMIGGTEDGARNVISGNRDSGVFIDGDGTTGNTVLGNFIGTDVTGSSTISPPGPPPPAFSVTALPETCPTYPADTNFDGFVSQSDDALSPWSGMSVHFLGTDECNGREMHGEASLIYRYRLEFVEPTLLTSIAVAGAAFNGPNSVLRVLDENMNLLASVETVGGNSFRTNFVLPQDVEGKTFYIDEFDTSTTWRFRQSIVVNGPLPLGNQGSGVAICCGASGNTLGGDSEPARNVISGNMSDGVLISDTGTTGNIVQGNLIGTDVNGTVALANLRGVFIVGGASNTLIGGTVPGARNVLSGNLIAGVNITGGTLNLVQGNFIGTDTTGTASVGNSGFGVVVDGGATGTVIGGTEEGARNLISGNGSDGVAIFNPGTTDNRVQGNYIGTDLTGTGLLGNGAPGVTIGDQATGNLIGGTEPGAGNVISGNVGSGIVLVGSGTTGTLIQGNFIGTDASGTIAIGNVAPGIWLGEGASDNRIGGTSPGSGNVISGNIGEGISINNPGTVRNVVQGNFIGTDVNGTGALPNASAGVFIGGAADNLIGGTDSGAGNVISGNSDDGIALHNPGTEDNVIQANRIGTDVTGMFPVPNLGHGVILGNNVNSTSVGGADPGAGNIIAFNGGQGVDLQPDSGTANAILSNSIFSNGSLGIDLGSDGVTRNDRRDRDAGPNDLQNFPVLTPPRTAGPTDRGRGFLSSTPNTTFRVEVFANPACDPSRHGEGRMFLGFAAVTTGRDGRARFEVEFSRPVSSGIDLTATATGPAGNTSEFSRCARGPSPFAGHWRGIDIGDLSDIRLTIAGGPAGPFQITWTESFFSGCDGGPGIVRGTGSLSQDDADVLVGELQFRCFTTGTEVDFSIEWRYDPVSDTISSGDVTWHRLGDREDDCLPPPAGLTGWWPGDGNASDIVGGHHGVPRGEPIVGGSGLVDLAFSFDGVDDFIDIQDVAALNFGEGDFTVDLWVLFKDTGGEQVLIEKWIQGESIAFGWTLTKLESNVLRLAMASATGGVDIDSAPLTIQTNVWHHFAAVRDGSAVTLFMNGVPIAFGSSSENLDSTSSLKFGHRGNPDDTPGSIDDRGFYLNGRIDEVELFIGRALSPEQILAIYEAGSAGKSKDEL